mgnify:CR=1 FL=1
MKITPAHDFNDFEVGKRHNLPQINIFSTEAKLQLKDNADFVAGMPNSADLDATLAMNGTDRFAARKAILARLEEKGLVEKIEPQSHVVPHGDRSNVVIEPFLTDQWYVNAKELAKPAIAAVRAGKTKFIPEELGENLFRLDGKHSAVVHSRASSGGAIRFRPGTGPTNKAFVALTEAEAQTTPTSTTERRRSSPATRMCSTHGSRPRCGRSRRSAGRTIRPELARYYPTSTLVTGFDIIFFWVARMMMMGLHFMKEIPFHDVYIHALVRDASGAKMSKSKGNVIDPLALIDEYGADALRFTLAAMAAQGRDIKLSTQRRGLP